MEYWDIYNDKKELTGKVIKRGDILKEDEYHLFVQVWLINDEGLFLCQQRSKKMKWPLMWCSNGGNAIAGEDSYTCARREILEELGIDISLLKGGLFDERKYFEDNQNYFCDSYLYEVSFKIKDYKVQTEEIETIAYKNIREIRKMMKNKSFFVYDDDYLDFLEEKAETIKSSIIKKVEN